MSDYRADVIIPPLAPLVTDTLSPLLSNVQCPLLAQCLSFYFLEGEMCGTDDMLYTPGDTAMRTFIVRLPES